MNDSLLFCDGELDASLNHIRRNMSAAIQKEGEEYLLNVDEEDWADQLADEYAVACPELLVESKEVVDLGEAQVDVSQYPNRAIFDRSTPTYWPGRRLQLRIPYTGDPGVFRLQARTRSYNPPRATIADGELRVTYEFPHDSKPDLQSAITQLINAIEQHLNWSRADIDSHNTGLRNEALQAIRARKQRVLSDHEYLDGLGIPVRRRDDAPTTFAAPGIERRSAHKPRAKVGKPEPLEPTMIGDLYEHRDRTNSLHGPGDGTYAGHLWAARGGATARPATCHAQQPLPGASHRRDVQCCRQDRHPRARRGPQRLYRRVQWWSGPADFLKALGQLFSYSTWRDTKTSLVVFVRAKGFTAVISKARAELDAHPEFIEREDSVDETELRCRMRWPGDPERNAELAVSFFHLAA